jgi:hypothetical protein
MVDGGQSRLAPETQLLEDVTARCGGPAAPTELEVYEALERGSARLVFLEAQLRHRNATRPEHASGAFPDLEDLCGRIARLREALAALRTRTTCETTSQLALGGFVLASGDG